MGLEMKNILVFVLVLWPWDNWDIQRRFLFARSPSQKQKINLFGIFLLVHNVPMTKIGNNIITKKNLKKCIDGFKID